MSKEEGFDFDSESPETEEHAQKGDEKQGKSNENEGVSAGVEHDDLMSEDEQGSTDKDKSRMQFNKEWLFYGAMALIVIIGLYIGYSFIFDSAPPKKPPVSQTHSVGFEDHTFAPVVSQKTTPDKPAKLVKSASLPPAKLSAKSMPTHTLSTPMKPVNHAPKMFNHSEVNRSMSPADIQKITKGVENIVDQSNNSLKTQISAIEKQQTILSQNNRNQDHSLQAQFQQLGATLNSLNVKLNDYNHRLKMVNHTLGITTSQLRVLVAQQADKAQKLTLRAVVQGRAWLVDGDGNTHSVAKGDRIPYYGKVVRINADNDSVEMSSGYTFQ